MKVTVDKTEKETTVTVSVNNISEVQVLKNIGYLLKRFFNHFRALLLQQKVEKPTIVQLAHIIQREVACWEWGDKV